VYDPDQANGTLGRAEQKIVGFLDNRCGGQMTSIFSILLDVMERIDDRVKQGHDFGGMNTGFTASDDLSGLQDSVEALRNARRATAHASVWEDVDPRAMLSPAEQVRVANLGSHDDGTTANILNDATFVTGDGMKHDQTLGGVETGFTEFDNITGGLHDSDLIILAGCQNIGKTALALNIAEHASMISQIGTLFVSLDLWRDELAERMLCSLAEVNPHRLRHGAISNGDRRRLVEAAAGMSQAPLFIDDSPRRTITEIWANAHQLKRKHGLGLIVIDYLQLIVPDDLREPREEPVERIARQLKRLACEFRVPVLCLAQLSGPVDAAQGNRPRLSQLGGSGVIEQHADMVIFLHRDAYFHTNVEECRRVLGQADIIIAKQRNRPIGDVKLAWQQEFIRFCDAATFEKYVSLAF